MVEQKPPQSASPYPSHREHIALWALACILIIQFAYFCAGSAVRPTNNFASYYTASRLVAEGESVSQFYDDAWFIAQIPRFHPELIDIYGQNPPTTSLLLLPLAGFNHAQARILWIFFNLLLLLAIGITLMKTLGFAGGWRPGFIVLVLVYQPLYAHFAVGQAYVVLLGLLLLAWYGYRHQRAALLGVALGLMLTLKLAGVLLWVLVLAQRRWRALGWSGATVLAAFLLTLPWFGLEAWQIQLQTLYDLRSAPHYAVTAYQTLHGFFHHLLVFDATWNPQPLFRLALLGKGLSWLGFAAVCSACVYVAVKKQDPDDTLFAAFVTANVLLSPVSQDYHYVLLLLPLAVMIQWIRTTPDLLRWLALGVSAVLLANNLPHQSPRLAAGLVALLAYPKLYGGLLLLGLCLWACRRSSPTTEDLSVNLPHDHLSMA